jgi:hypothetical protein
LCAGPEITAVAGPFDGGITFRGFFDRLLGLAVLVVGGCEGLVCTSVSQLESAVKFDISSFFSCSRIAKCNP